VTVALLSIGLACGHHFAIEHAESQLISRGLSWDKRTSEPFSVQWINVQGAGITADAVVARFGWPITITIESPDVDLSDANINYVGDPTSPTNGESPQIPIHLSVEDLSISWGERPLLSELSGALTPLPNLQGPRGQVSVRQTANGQTEVYGESDIDIDLPHIKGSGTVMLTKSDIWTIELDVPNTIFEHEMLANQALPPNPLNATAVWKPETSDLNIKGAVGDIPWDVHGTFDLETADLQVSIPMVDLSAIVQLFGPLIPEGNHARINGQIGLSGTLQGPEWAWTAEPAVDDLRVTGALPPTFGGHDIQWKVRTEDGAMTYRSTGPGTPGWVHHEAAGWMPAAVVAAEDIRFHSHPGFDLIAIQEALQAAPKDERVRGGSTISQQLSKNLFLDGRRTLCRKLRELLITLSVEHRMSKEAILTLYLNIVEFGPGIYGVGNAADAWFIKRPSGLTPREAAFLASILPAPRMWHERISKTGSVPIRRVNEVLTRMGRRGDLTAPQLQRAKRAKLRVVPP
jgi:hypothetical protein